MGVIFLTACSADLGYDELSNELPANEAIVVNTITVGYISPWEFQNNLPIAYVYQSALYDNYGIYVRITPYIGLGYFDGIDDGVYNTLGSGSFIFNSVNYPNLYNNSTEYGNYIQANPIVLGKNGGFTPPTNNWYTHELVIHSKEAHCPVKGVTIGYNYNLQTIQFDVLNNDMVQPVTALGYTISPAPAAATPHEEDLLAQYGKVMYYKLEFGTDPFNFTDEFYVSALEWDSSKVDMLEWSPVGTADEFGNDLYYNKNSYEIVYDKVNASNNNIQYRMVGESIDTSFGTTHQHQLIYNHPWGGFPGVQAPAVGILIE